MKAFGQRKPESDFTRSNGADDYGATESARASDLNRSSRELVGAWCELDRGSRGCGGECGMKLLYRGHLDDVRGIGGGIQDSGCARPNRSEEHTSELQSLMRISSAV